MMVIWLIVLVVVIWAIVSVARRGGRPPWPRGGTESAQQILHERYARGEIDEATYHRMLDELRR